MVSFFSTPPATKTKKPEKDIESPDESENSLSGSGNEESGSGSVSEESRSRSVSEDESGRGSESEDSGSGSESEESGSGSDDENGATSGDGEGSIEVSQDEEDNEVPKKKKKEKVMLPADVKEAQKERTIFIGNLPLDVTVKEVKKIFSQYGNVEAVRFRGIAFTNEKLDKKVRAIKGDYDQKLKDNKNAYVVFQTPAAIKQALKAHNTVIGGKHIRIDALSANRVRSSFDISDISQKKKPTFCIFVGNIPFKASEETTRAHFENLCGSVDYVRLIRDPKTQRCTGIGYVNFESRESFSAALKLDGRTKLEGRPLRITRAKEELNKERPARRHKPLPGAIGRVANKEAKARAKEHPTRRHKPVSGGQQLDKTKFSPGNKRSPRSDSKPTTPRSGERKGRSPFGRNAPDPNLSTESPSRPSRPSAADTRKRARSVSDKFKTFQKKVKKQKTK